MTTIAVEPHDLLQRRGEHLANGLARMGVAPGQVLPVLVCAGHVDDLDVAVVAAARLGADALVLPVDLAVDELTERLQRLRGGVLLACAEGVEAWRRTGVGLRVVGDGEGVVWWRLLEAREARDLRSA